MLTSCKTCANLTQLLTAFEINFLNSGHQLYQQ